MKQTVKLAAIAIILVFILGALLSIANAPALDPASYTEARATATASAIESDREARYNEYVLPTQQAVEAQEIAETTRNQYEHARALDAIKTTAKTFTIAGLAFGAFAVCVGFGIGIGGYFGARGVVEMRKATLPMTRLLVEGPHITEHGTVFHTVTGAVVRIDAPGDAQPDHARLVSATYQALPPGIASSLIAAVSGGTATRAQIAQARHYNLLEG